MPDIEPRISDMEKKNNKAAAGRSSLNMRSIFRCMMEEGYYPTFEKTHIQFGIDDNIGVVEYEENILSIRLFFSIEEDVYDLFLEASNAAMMETYIVKPVILDDMKNIMFSCEIMCDTLREFRKFFPRGIERLNEALMMHKAEMKKLLLAEEVAGAKIPATDDIASMTGTSKSRKVVS